MTFTIQLSQEGNQVQIASLTPQKQIPEQLEASACKTCEEVLQLLKKIQASSYQSLFQFEHQNNPHYREHKGNAQKLATHSCSLEKQISFLQYKILEKEHGSRKADYAPPKALKWVKHQADHL